jgi:hypothetical protein
MAHLAKAKSFFVSEDSFYCARVRPQSGESSFPPPAPLDSRELPRALPGMVLSHLPASLEQGHVL